MEKKQQACIQITFAAEDQLSIGNPGRNPAFARALCGTPAPQEATSFAVGRVRKKICRGTHRGQVKKKTAGVGSRRGLGEIKSDGAGLRRGWGGDRPPWHQFFKSDFSKIQLALELVFVRLPLDPERRL